MTLNTDIPNRSRSHDHPFCQTITASVKDTQVNGVEGLNIKWSAPFKFQDWVVGFKTTLGDFSKAPEEFFAKKSFDAGDGTATVDAEYTVDSKKLAVNGKWVGKSGLELRAKGNTGPLNSPLSMLRQLAPHLSYFVLIVSNAPPHPPQWNT